MTIWELRERLESQVTVTEFLAFMTCVAFGCYVWMLWQKRKNERNGKWEG